MVDSANVYLKLNGQLNLDISQRIPIFRLSKKDKSFYVDEKGVEFPDDYSYFQSKFYPLNSFQSN